MFTLQCIGGNNYVIIRGSSVIIDLMASATWLANPSLLMIFFPDGTRGFWAYIFEKMVVVIHIYHLLKVFSYDELGHTKLIICFWFPAWSIFFAQWLHNHKIRIVKMLLILFRFTTCMLCKYSTLMSRQLFSTSSTVASMFVLFFHAAL